MSSFYQRFTARLRGGGSIGLCLSAFITPSVVYAWFWKRNENANWFNQRGYLLPGLDKYMIPKTVTEDESNEIAQPLPNPHSLSDFKNSSSDFKKSTM